MANFTEIVSIEAPQSAAEGESVDIVVTVKNKNYWGDGRNQWVAVTGVADGVTIPFQPENSNIPSLQTAVFTGSFTMPGKNVTAGVGTWVPWLSNGVLGDWRIEEQRSLPIALSGDVPGPTPDEESEIPWLALAGIGGVALLGILLIRRK